MGGILCFLEKEEFQDFTTYKEVYDKEIVGVSKVYISNLDFYITCIRNISKLAETFGVLQ